MKRPNGATKMDLILSNIEKSRDYTIEKMKMHREEISRSLKDKLTKLALQKVTEKENAPSWKETSEKEVQTSAEIFKRIERVKFLRKIRPVLKAVLTTLVVHHFMRSVMILLDNIKMMEDEPLSPVPSLPKRGVQKTDLQKVRLQRDSRFSYGMLAMFQESSKLRMVINRLTTFRLEALIEKRQDVISKAAVNLTIFGRRVARRRIIDLCILVANLNSFIAQKYAAKGMNNQITTNMPETINVLGKQVKLLSNKTHLTSGFLQKHRTACTEFAADADDITGELFRLLRSLLREFLPFSLNWASLQFDKSYFLLKKTNITEDLLNVDILSKLKVVEELYKERSVEFGKEAKKYRKKIQSFASQNPMEVERKRTEYMFQHSYDHIDKLSKSIKEVGTTDDGHIDFLPFRSMKWAFVFAESLCKDLVPSIDFNITADCSSKFLESYNKLLKVQFQTFVAESAKFKREKSPRNAGEHTSEESESDN
jgi:hypothetical protein